MHTRDPHLHAGLHSFWSVPAGVTWGLASVLDFLPVYHSPLVAELAGEAVKVIHIVPGPHHHLEGWDQLAAGSAVSRGAEQPVEGRVQMLWSQPGSSGEGGRRVASTRGPTCLS